MAYRLKLKESLQRGVRRIAVEQLGKALSAPDAGGERGPWVHETRKTLKRLRALLRLVRGGLDASVWEAENRTFRDIARLLSPMRDRDIMGPVLAGLATGQDRLAGPILRIAERLAARCPESALGEAEGAQAIFEARALLAAARERMEDLTVEGNLQVIADGLEEGQRRGQKALARVQATPSDGNVHDLRKAVQTTWRQTALVQSAWPEVMTARVAAARELSQVLGDIQDLAVLAVAVHEVGGNKREIRDAALVAEACRQRQLALQAMAFPMAARLFAMPARSCGAELVACWEASLSVAEETTRQRKAAVAASRSPRAAGVKRQRKSS